MRVRTEVKALEGGSFARLAQSYVATAQIIAGVQLVVAQLEILVGIVVFPPGTVETGAIGEMSVKRIIFYCHIRDGTKAVVARHISQIEEQIGLDAEQLPAVCFCDRRERNDFLLRHHRIEG